MNSNRAAHGTRHRYLNLFQFRFPISAILSVGHRLSGILLFLLTPVLILGLEYSLASPENFQRLGEWFQHGLVSWGLLLVLWAAFHHLFAGIRFLLMDIGIGEQKRSARNTARAVLISAFVAAAVTAWVAL